MQSQDVIRLTEGQSCKQLQWLHLATCEPGKGATFHILLPATISEVRISLKFILSLL